MKFKKQRKQRKEWKEQKVLPGKHLSTIFANSEVKEPKDAAALFCAKHFTYPLELNQINGRFIFNVTGLRPNLLFRVVEQESDGLKRFYIFRVFGETI